MPTVMPTVLARSQVAKLTSTLRFSKNQDVAPGAGWLADSVAPMGQRAGCREARAGRSCVRQGALPAKLRWQVDTHSTGLPKMLYISADGSRRRVARRQSLLDALPHRLSRHQILIGAQRIWVTQICLLSQMVRAQISLELDARRTGRRHGGDQLHLLARHRLRRRGGWRQAEPFPFLQEQALLNHERE